MAPEFENLLAIALFVLVVLVVGRSFFLVIKNLIRERSVASLLPPIFIVITLGTIFMTRDTINWQSQFDALYFTTALITGLAWLVLTVLKIFGIQNRFTSNLWRTTLFFIAVFGFVTVGTMNLLVPMEEDFNRENLLLGTVPEIE